MPTNCSVNGCGGTGVNKSYFTLPAVFKFKQCPEEKANLSKERRKLWLKALGIKDDEFSTRIRVCSDHFLTGRPAALEDTDDIDWVPTLHMKLPNLPPNKKRKVIPVEKVKAKISAVNKIIASKGSGRSYGFRRGEFKKTLNCKVLLDGNLRCTSFNGTNGSGLAIIQKHGIFTSDNVTLRETAINNTVLRVRLIREDLYSLRRKYMSSFKQKKAPPSTLGRQVNRKSVNHAQDLAFNSIESFSQVTPVAKQRARVNEMHNMSDPVKSTSVRSSIQSKLQNRLVVPRHSLDNTKTLNRAIRRNDKDKIKVKFFPKTSTPIRRNVKNGTIISDTSEIVTTPLKLHREILFLNQYKLTQLQQPPVIEEPELSYYLKFDPIKKQQESLLNYPFQKLVMDVKHMKLPGPSWKIIMIIRDGRISAIRITNKLELERAVSFTANSNSYNIVIENKPVTLLGAPHHLRNVKDVEVLIDIVAAIDTENPMLLYKSIVPQK